MTDPAAANQLLSTDWLLPDLRALDLQHPWQDLYYAPQSYFASTPLPQEYPATQSYTSLDVNDGLSRINTPGLESMSVCLRPLPIDRIWLTELTESRFPIPSDFLISDNLHTQECGSLIITGAARCEAPTMVRYH